MSLVKPEIEQLKSDIIAMWSLVRNQLYKTRQALLEFDVSLAMEVVAQEKRVNAFELNTSMRCEKILALHQPVANELRFVLACLKIAYNLERIGDYAKNIAKLVINSEQAFDNEILEEARISKMYFIADIMLSDAMKAFVEENTDAINRVFTNDKQLNEVNEKSPEIIRSIIQKNPNLIENALNLFTLIRKLERVGDQTKNISEEIIFYVEAKIVRHQKELVK